MTANNETQNHVSPNETNAPSNRPRIVSGGTGVALGILGSTLISATTMDASPRTDHDSADNTNDVEQPHNTDLKVATSVSDDMSFGQAFAAARHEVGSGGVFVWHNGVYGTYYGSEWSDMTSQEQKLFSHEALVAAQNATKEPKATVQEETSSNEEDNTEDGDDDEVLAENTNEAEEETSEETPENTDQTTTNDTIATPTENEIVAIPEPVIELDDEQYSIEVLRIEEEVDLGSGHMGNVGFGIVDNHNAVFIDTDQDNEFDYVMIDTNNDGRITDADYISEIQGGTDLDVNHFAQNINVSNQTDSLADLGDDASDVSNAGEDDPSLFF